MRVEYGDHDAGARVKIFTSGLLEKKDLEQWFA
jgi:hypothetical protein